MIFASTVAFMMIEMKFMNTHLFKIYLKFTKTPDYLVNYMYTYI